MELRLRRDLFLAELSPMQGIVERRTTIPVLSHILLKTSAKSLQLAATDLDVSLTSAVAAEVEGQGALAVQAKKFTEIVRSVVADEVRLKVEDDRTLLIQAGKARFRMHGLPAADFPSLPTVEGKAKIELPLGTLPPPGEQDPLRGVGRGLALSALRRAAEDQGEDGRTGGDRRPSAGAHRVAARLQGRGGGFGAGAAQGPAGADAHRGRRQRRLPARRAPPLVLGRRARDDLPRARRAASRTTTG